jgi:DNA-binding Lrp family transcriptional regulator
MINLYFPLLRMELSTIAFIFNRALKPSGRLVMTSRPGSLSHVDRELLKVILTPDGHRTSAMLAKKLGIPATTVQRRRKRLEADFLKVTYSLDLEKFGWRKVDFLLATERGKTTEIAKELLKRDDVVYVGRSIGQQTIDLKVETVVKGNSEILMVQELLKGMDGIREVVWTEIVEVIGEKSAVPSRIIDEL